MLSLAKQSLPVSPTLQGRESCSRLRVAVWSQSVGRLSVLAANASVPESNFGEACSMLPPLLHHRRGSPAISLTRLATLVHPAFYQAIGCEQVLT